MSLLLIRHALAGHRERVGGRRPRAARGRPRPAAVRRPRRRARLVPDRPDRLQPVPALRPDGRAARRGARARDRARRAAGGARGSTRWGRCSSGYAARTWPSARTVTCRGSATGSSRRARPGSWTTGSCPSATSSRLPRRPVPQRATRERRLRGGPLARRRAGRPTGAVLRRARRLRPGMSVRARSGNRTSRRGRRRSRSEARLGLGELLRAQRPPDDAAQATSRFRRWPRRSAEAATLAFECPLDTRPECVQLLAPRRVVDEVPLREPQRADVERPEPDRLRGCAEDELRRAAADVDDGDARGGRRERRDHAREREPPLLFRAERPYGQPRRSGDRVDELVPFLLCRAGAVTSTSIRAAPSLAASRA